MLGAFVGRLHVVLVHFPIALVLAAALFEALALARRQRAPSELARSLVALGALGALAAAGSGWLLAEHDPPGSSLAVVLERHRWLGLGSAAAALGAAVLGARAGTRARDARGGGTASFRAALVLAALGVGTTGHLGGSMVHGEDFLLGPLFERSPGAVGAPAPAGPGDGGSPAVGATGTLPAAAGDGFDFAGRVEPLFARHCLECHGPAKQKGRLRLDRRADVLDRPAEDAIVVPGEPDASELLRRVMLPPLDPDAMPAKGDPLTADEQATLREWIAAGAPWPGPP